MSAGEKKALNVTDLMGDAAPERPQRELMASDTACLAPIWPPTLPFKPLFFQMYSPRVTARYNPHATLPFSRGTTVFLGCFFFFSFYSAGDGLSDTAFVQRCESRVRWSAVSEARHLWGALLVCKNQAHVILFHVLPRLEREEKAAVLKAFQRLLVSVWRVNGLG